jgi:hypothetical protein
MNAREAYRTCVEITIRDGDRGSINMSFRDGPQDQTSGAHLRTGESRDPGSFAAQTPPE